MEEIRLNDILVIDDLENVKIRLNLSNKKWNAIELFHSDPDRMLVGHFHNSENRKWFKEGQVLIGLVKIKQDEWLLIDVSVITKSFDEYWDGETVSHINSFYEHEKIKRLEKYFGRIIVKYHKNGAYAVVNGSRMDEFLVKEILPSSFDDDEFPGYDKVNVSWNELTYLLKKDAWKTVLQNQKGVYLITDTSNGKTYVGSAYGKDMILGRWLSYLKNGHGGNKGLKQLEFEHIKSHFKYSILDIFKSTADDKLIIERESWWKEVLQSRAFGYNEN